MFIAIELDRSRISAFFIRLHPIAPEPVLVRDLFLFFVHGIVFHIQFDIMFLAVTVIVIAAISGIGRRLSGKASIGSVISFHKRNVCIPVIGITGYIDMADVAVAATHLHIVSGLEYIGMIIIVVFHMHEGGIRIGLRKTVPSYRWYRSFQNSGSDHRRSLRWES